MTKWIWKLGAVLAAVAIVIAVPAHARASSPECTPRSQPIQKGLTLVKEEHPDDRTTIYYFKSLAVGPSATPDGLVRARVVLPKQYASEPMRKFPVVYHLHGTNNSAITWNLGDVERYVLGDTPAILVMPDGSNYGFYTDHMGVPIGAKRQPPAWDTFHNEELLPWIDQHLRTTGRHAVAGSSMGGFGSIAYPERHPGLYDAAASLSGAVDIELPGVQPVLDAAWGPCIWGDPILDAANWHANNPTEHVDKLKGVSLYVSSGNGLPGKRDDLTSPVTAPALEVLVHAMTLNFIAALKQAGIPATINLYGNGEHPDGIATSRHYDFDSMRSFLAQALPVMQARAAAATPACTSRRTVRTTVKIAKRSGPIRSASATLAGKRVKTKVNGRTVTTTANLKGMAKSTVKLVVTVRLRSGKTVRSTRTYKTCQAPARK